jgi:hypothetical protein
LFAWRLPKARRRRRHLRHSPPRLCTGVLRERQPRSQLAKPKTPKTKTSRIYFAKSAFCHLCSHFISTHRPYHPSKTLAVLRYTHSNAQNTLTCLTSTGLCSVDVKCVRGSSALFETRSCGSKAVYVCCASTGAMRVVSPVRIGVKGFLNKKSINSL